MRRPSLKDKLVTIFETTSRLVAGSYLHDVLVLSSSFLYQSSLSRYDNISKEVEEIRDKAKIDNKVLIPLVLGLVRQRVDTFL